MKNPKFKFTNLKQITNANFNSKPKFWLLVIVGSLVLGVWNLSCCAATAQQTVNAANKLYKQQKLDEALQKYNDASVKLPDSDIINFNMGTVLYKKEDYQKAIDAFTKSLTSEDKQIEADALYNIGNCKYKLGKLKENTDLAATVDLLRESLDYYKRAVELDQKNTDARFNHEFVERELKVLLDKLKQQQEQNKQGSCPIGKEQGGEDKEKEESAKEKEQKQQEKEGQQEQKQSEQEKQLYEESQQEWQEQELSEEAAHALLERYGRDEAKPDYRDKSTSSHERQVLKDW